MQGTCPVRLRHISCERESVCNACQCQNPPTVHLVMRSVVQTRTQPTQQHRCPLCGSEYYYMYWLHELRGPSCDCLPAHLNKGLVLHCPLVADKLHPCLECRWVACQLRSWRFLCSETRTALSCSRWFWETLPNFSELHYWAPLGDDIPFPLISRVCAFKESGL